MNRDEPIVPISEAVAIFEASATRAAARYRALAGAPMIGFARADPLPLPPAGWRDTRYAVTFDGRLAILRTAELAGASEEWPENGRAAMVCVFDGEYERDVVEFTLRHPCTLLDRLASGAWIVVDDDPADPLLGATLVARDGATTSLSLGFDMMQLQADPDGGFWIGYGDVGIFTGDREREAGGVVRFDDAGRVVWRMNFDQARRPDCVAMCTHCYALSIAAGGRWAYTYTDFLLTRLGPGSEPRVLRPPVAFADVLAAHDGRFLFIGRNRGLGERDRHEQMVLLGPPDPATPRRPSVRWLATIDRGTDSKERLWTARGDTAHCVRDGVWHRLSIDEADARVPPGPWRVG